LTKEEGALVVAYAAARQGYSDDVAALDITALSERAQRLLEDWDVYASQLANEVLALQEKLPFKFTPVEKGYFPMRHFIGQRGAGKSIDALFEEVSGVAASRKGNFEGVIKDPVVQLTEYLRDVTLLLETGKYVASLREDAIQHADETAAALEKDPESLSDAEKVAYARLQKIRDAEAYAEKLGIPKSMWSNPNFYKAVSMLNNDGGGGALKTVEIGGKKLRWWNTADPFFVFRQMDGLSPDNPDGRAFGAHSRMWRNVVLNGVKRHKSAVVHEQSEMLMCLRVYGTEESIRDLNHKLADLLLGNKDSRKQAFRARTANQLGKSLKLSETEAEFAFWIVQKIKEHHYRIGVNGELRSDLQEIAKDRRARFFELEEKVNNETATDAELSEYMGFAPDATSNISRKAIRFLFEKQAIDSKDFFGYYDSLVNASYRSEIFNSIIEKTTAWADYLESKGQVDHAEIWRLKIESNIKGNLFKFEDSLLTFASEQVKKRLGKKVSSLEHTTPERIKVRMVEAMQMLQRARVHAFLAGNIGWSLTTQPSSLSLTIKQVGYWQTARALMQMISGGVNYSDAVVPMIKGKIAGVESFEATRGFEEYAVRQSLRKKIRNRATWFGSVVEDFTTKWSYLAGENYARETLKLSEEEARFYGDYVAATTQTMYDQVSRNTALNSHIYRALRPMQSYVLTAYSNVLDSLNLVGGDRSAAVRVREVARWLIAQRLWAWLWSVFFGDSAVKAALNPVYSKGTLGSNIPVVGKDVDVFSSQMLPWVDDKTWMQAESHEQFAKNTARILSAVAQNKENWERELAVYTVRYITPWAGISGSVMMENAMETFHAVLSDGDIEGISGRKYAEFSDYENPAKQLAGVMFGIKAIDEPETMLKKKN